MNSELTFGACAERLRANGFFPCSAFFPDAPGDYRLSEHPCGILCRPGEVARRIGALVITTRDKGVGKKILGLLAKRGLSAGPCRTDSAGAQTYLLQVNEYNPPPRRVSETVDGELSPALAFDSWSSKGLGAPHESAFVPLAGEWTNGSPLTVNRSDLPSIDSDVVDALFKELLVGVFPRAPYVDPRVPESELPVNLRKVHEPRMAAPRSKMDFRGGTVSMIELAKTDGSWDSLPDLPPPEKEPA